MEYDTWAENLDTTTVTVDAHELDVAYYDDGDGDGDGDPILFCHGIPTSSFLWRDVAPPLSDDYRVIVPDMVGYGKSAMHDGFDRSIRAQEELIDGLVAELGLETISFVGHDLGGGVGLRYAAHNPDAVERLVLSNAVCYDSWPIETIVDLGVPSTIAEMGVQDVREMLEEVFRETRYDDPNAEFVDGMLAPWDSDEAIVSLSRNAIGTNTSHTTEIDPSEISARTLLLWGGEDQFQAIEYAQQLETDIPDAELVGLDEASHWVMADRPTAYLDRLREFFSGE